MMSSPVPQILSPIRPQTADQVVDAIAQARAVGRRLEIIGGGTKRPFGGPVTADAVLDMRGLSGIDFYEPEELVLKVRAGTPMADVHAALAEKKQHLGFEPPSYAGFFGHSEASETIGSIIACNLAGPRRVQAGAPRDAVLGVEGVNGLGERFKAGGRTVKNVTGYDLPKLMTGSFGTLAALTSVTLKVLPAPPAETSLLLIGLADAKAIEMMAGALTMPIDVSAAIHFGGIRDHVPTTAIRLEGMQGSVDARAAELESRLHKVAHLRIVRDDESRAFWDAARDLRSLDSARHNCVWRILLPATHAARLVNVVGGEAVYEWGGSELFIGMGSVQAAEEAGRLRMMADHAGGSACLFRAPIEIRQTLGAFQPRPKPLQDLMERIRQMFDPAGILNPGKLASAQ